jgi:hypothetical protein
MSKLAMKLSQKTEIVSSQKKKKSLISGANPSIFKLTTTTPA